MPKGAKPQQRERLLQRDRYRCHYCGVRLARDSFTLDHIVPRSQGGSTALYNLVSCCTSCNQAKADADVWCLCLRCGYARSRHAMKVPRQVPLDVAGCACVRCGQVKQYG